MMIIRCIFLYLVSSSITCCMYAFLLYYSHHYLNMHRYYSLFLNRIGQLIFIYLYCYLQQWRNRNLNYKTDLLFRFVIDIYPEHFYTTSFLYGNWNSNPELANPVQFTMHYILYGETGPFFMRFYSTRFPFM